MLKDGKEKSSYEIEREESAQRYIKGDDYLSMIEKLKEDIKERDKKNKELTEKMNKINQISLI